MHLSVSEGLTVQIVLGAEKTTVRSEVILLTQEVSVLLMEVRDTYCIK